MVNFEPQGAALLRDGKVKEALASYRALIAQNPNSAVHHLQVANVLLEAGMGEAARDEARLAVKLDPNVGAGRAHAGRDSEARPGGPEFARGQRHGRRRGGVSRGHQARSRRSLGAGRPGHSA
jgi:tetratricopeptide (TPR) repeat protein